MASMEAKQSSFNKNDVREVVYEVFRDGEYITKSILREEMDHQRMLYESYIAQYMGSLIENLNEEKKALFEYFLGHTNTIDSHERRITVLESRP